MAEARYPAWDKRVALLRCVHEWIRERDAAEDLRAVVDGEVLARWASGIEGMSTTEKGLLTIGEMPDPQERLILGVEAAIRSIQRDPTMDPAEKQRKIDWFEEFKHVVRSLTVETAKTVLRGEVPPM